MSTPAPATSATGEWKIKLVLAENKDFDVYEVTDEHGKRISTGAPSGQTAGVASQKAGHP